MRIAILGFAVGAALCQWQAALPGWWILAVAAAGGLLAALLAATLRRRSVKASALLAAGVLAGFFWACGFATLRLAESLPSELEGQDMFVTGVVTGLPQSLDSGQRFVFEVEQADVAGVPRRLLLGWYRGLREAETETAREVHAGERWRLRVRLKRPHGNLNPHGFDYEAQLFDPTLTLASDISAESGVGQGFPGGARNGCVSRRELASGEAQDRGRRLDLQ